MRKPNHLVLTRGVVSLKAALMYDTRDAQTFDAMPRGIVRLGYYISLWIWIWGPPALGQFDERPRILMVAFEEAAIESRDTAASVRAGLHEFNADFQVTWQRSAADVEHELRMAKNAVANTHARVVFWRRGKKILFFVPELDQNRLLERPIQSSVKESFSDTVSLIVNRMVSALLARDRASDTMETESGIPSGEPVHRRESASNPKEPSLARKTTFEAESRTQTVFRNMPSIVSGSKNEVSEADKGIEPSTPEEQPVSEAAKEKAPVKKIPDSAAKSEERPPSKDDIPSEGKALITEPSKASNGSLKRFQPEILYGLDGIASGFVLHGARLGAGIRLVSDLYLILDYTVSSRLEIRLGEFSGIIRIFRHPVGLGLRYFFATWGRLCLGSGALIELDVMRKKTTSSQKDVATSPDGIDLQTSVIPFVSTGVHLTGPVFATASIGMRVVMDKTQYWTRSTPAAPRTNAFSPWRVQPRFSVGLFGNFF